MGLFGKAKKGFEGSLNFIERAAIRASIEGEKAEDYLKKHGPPAAKKVERGARRTARGIEKGYSIYSQGIEKWDKIGRSYEKTQREMADALNRSLPPAYGFNQNDPYGYGDFQGPKKPKRTARDYYGYFPY